MKKFIDTLKTPALHRRLIILGAAKKLAYAGFFAFTMMTTPAEARDYTIDYGASKIEFSGTHADNPFKGSFGEWTAEITFDPANIETSKIVATFKPDSAKTGDAMYDGTLPQTDWFNTKEHPQATFASTTVRDNEGGGYIADGNLTIRGITKPVQLAFTLSDLEQSPVTAKGSLTINRLDFDLGQKSDGDAEWVSREIKIDITLVATPK